MGITSLCVAVLLPLVRVLLLSPQVSYHASLETDPELYVLALDCSDCHEDVSTEIFHYQHHLLAKSFRAARMLGATRANFVSGTYNNGSDSSKGTLIGVSNEKEANKVRSNVQELMKKSKKLKDVSSQLVRLPAHSNVVQSMGLMDGWLAQEVLLPYKLKWAAKPLAQQNDLNLDEALTLTASFHNVLPRSKSQLVDFGMFFFAKELQQPVQIKSTEDEEPSQLQRKQPEELTALERDNYEEEVIIAEKEVEEKSAVPDQSGSEKGGLVVGSNEEL